MGGVKCAVDLGFAISGSTQNRSLGRVMGGRWEGRSEWQPWHAAPRGAFAFDRTPPTLATGSGI